MWSVALPPRNQQHDLFTPHSSLEIPRYRWPNVNRDRVMIETGNSILWRRHWRQSECAFPWMMQRTLALYFYSTRISSTFYSCPQHCHNAKVIVSAGGFRYYTVHLPLAHWELLICQWAEMMQYSPPGIGLCIPSTFEEAVRACWCCTAQYRGPCLQTVSRRRLKKMSRLLYLWLSPPVWVICLGMDTYLAWIVCGEATDLRYLPVQKSQDAAHFSCESCPSRHG